MKQEGEEELIPKAEVNYKKTVTYHQDLEVTNLLRAR